MISPFASVVYVLVATGVPLRAVPETSNFQPERTPSALLLTIFISPFCGALGNLSLPLIDTSTILPASEIVN